MYNLFVTAMEGAWDQPFYEYHRSRFLEFTNDKISNALEALTDNDIKTLKSYPCLFAYEGTDSDVRIGFLTAIKERGRNLLVEYNFFDEIPAIPFSSIKPITPLLDIRDWEMNRTHWAVKDEDLFRRLISASLIEASILDKIELPDKSAIVTPTRATNPKVTTVQEKHGCQAYTVDNKATCISEV